MIFTSDEVTSENHWQITPRVTKKIVIRSNEYIIFSYTLFYVFNTIPLETNIVRSFRRCR